MVFSLSLIRRLKSRKGVVTLSVLSNDSVQTWATAGWQRVRLAFWPVLQAALAAAVAFNIGTHLLHHESPFFAAIAAWMCLGWSFERDIRRVAEVGFGVTLGVTIGDLVVSQIGSGWWQLSSVLVVSVLLARFVNSGAFLVTQAGSQAIVIAGLPNLVGGPYGRALDAAVGAAVALLFVVLTPYRPSKLTRQNTAAAAMALSSTAALLASGLRTGNEGAMEAALKAGRQSEPLLSNAVSQASGARRQVRWTIGRKQEALWAEVERRDQMLERAMRSLRVLARRLRFDAAQAAASERIWLAGILDQYSAATLDLAQAVRADEPTERERVELTALAQELTAHQPSDPGIATGAAVFRAVIVDTLVASGATQDEAASLVVISE